MDVCQFKHVAQIVQVKDTSMTTGAMRKARAGMYRPMETNLHVAALK